MFLILVLVFWLCCKINSIERLKHKGLERAKEHEEKLIKQGLTQERGGHGQVEGVCLSFNCAHTQKEVAHAKSKIALGSLSVPTFFKRAYAQVRSGSQHSGRAHAQSGCSHSAPGYK
jgi:hypothetical protein